MKAKFPLYATLAALVLAMLLAVGCDRINFSRRSDAEIARDVQARINADAGIANKQITIQSGSGVVTLSGTVNNDAERVAAASDAAAIDGVKTVVNNLQVAPQRMAQQTYAAAAPAPAQERAPAPRPVRKRVAPTKPAPSRTHDYSQSASAEPAPAAGSMAAPAAPSNVTLAPSTPPAPVRVTVPDGAMLSIRLIDPVDSERNHPGDIFKATLENSVTVNDQVAIPADADVEGRVVETTQAGHYAGRSTLAIELTRISYNGQSYEIQTDQYSRQGSSRGARTAKTVGGGAALGAIIGGIAGAGGAVQGVTKPEVIRLGSEAVLSFRLTSPVSVTPASSARRHPSQPQ